MSYIYKHGLPGIGVTGQQGKQGKSGNSIYFGTFDSFFKYIDTSTLSSIDYDDKDYDITYAKDEYRLDPKYNEGDLLYILNSSLKDSSIDCVIEITEDLTTCTSTQLANSIKYENPFTVNKSKFNRLNIVGSRNNKDHSIKHGMFMANELYNNYPINVTYVVDSINSKPVKVEDLNDPSIDVADEPFIIPERYLNTEETHLYLNNGREINKYTQKLNTNKGEVLLNLNSSSHLLEIQSYLNSNMSIYIDNTNISDPLDPSDASRNLYIDNLYVRNNNKGNIEALNTLYNNELVLNSYGNCYTLTEDNYDSSTQSFIMNVDNFFNNSIDVSKDDYVYGYVHMYYNYNDMNNKNSGVRSCYYSNYIKGTFTDTSLSKVRVPKTDNNGNYIRDYNNESYKNVASSEIKQVLINTWNTSTLENVSFLLPETVNTSTFNIYKDVKGIIQTEEVQQYKIYDKVTDVSSGYYYKKYHIDSSVFIYDRSNNLQANVKFNDYFDTSYYSCIDTKQFDYTDSSVLKISLDKSDNDSQKYRHHIIQQYIGNKHGIKYFSKLTYADFNYQTSEFDIDASFVQIYHKDLNRILNYDDVFNITITDNTMTLEFKDKLTKLYNICVYENSTQKNKIALNEDTGICQVNEILDVTQDIEKDVITKIPDDKFLKYVYDASVISIPNTEVLYTIKYNTIEDDTAVDETNSTDKIVYSNTVTYNRIIKGYTEKRTIPEVKMNIYNDLESLENINNSSNGILCNQFQTFMTLEIDKFSNDDWGLYKEYLPDPKLRIYINKNISDKPSLTADDNTIKEWIFKYTLYKPGIDIYNISANELDNQSIIKVSQTDKNEEFYEFTIDEAMSGIWYLRIYMESQNPEPYTFNLQYTIDKIQIITSDNKHTFTLKAKDINKDNLYESNTLKLSIAPISYIASYSQNISSIQTRYLQHPNAIGVRKWFGSDEVTNIAIMPYRYDEISQKKVNNKAYKIPNWNSISFKNRYLQDNIKTLSIFTQNINDIYTLLSNKLYKNTWLCEDTDDITENYLRLIFNANIFVPRLLNDQYSFIYNNQRLLASQYSQLSNNSAVYIHQYNDINLRTDSLLKSIMKWNDEYEKSYHYETDNPFRGHIETYGNGYQYLPNSADNSQYNQYMSLKEIKQQNELQFFDLGLNKVKTYDINKPDKRDAYTPPVLFNQLLYQASWCYPYYTTNNDEVQNSKSKQYIKQLDFDNAVTLENGVLDANKMPYNLCYNIYPRMMFNDEEQYNVVLMLRRPSIKNEGQYEFKSKDIQLKFNISQIQSINKYLYPLN